MKKALLSSLVVMFAMSVSMADTPGTYVPTQDVLGAHQNGGRGCAGCHTPHSGARGSGQATLDGVSGNDALWGQDVSVLYGTTISSGPGYVTSFSAATTWKSPEGAGLMMCLSCHDGNVTPQNMMTNQSYEQKLKLLPATYGSTAIPTLLGNDGTTQGNYSNDHPVGINAQVDPTDWAGTGVTWSNVADTRNGGFKVVITVAAASQFENFLAVYNDAALQNMKTDGSVYFPVCTTCHDQHTMNVYNAGGMHGTPVAGISNPLKATQGVGTYQSFFFVRGPYNVASQTMVGAAGAQKGQAASTTQFCRQCHFGESNEGNNAAKGSIPTVF